MAEELQVITVLAIGLGAACIAGYISLKLKLSPLLGYLLAGYLLGPNSPGFIGNQYISDQLANIGVTLLMFTVGLTFSWKDIQSVKSIVLPGGLILSFLSILAGMGLCFYLGETLTAGFVVGVAICVSSTVVIVRVLADQNLLHSKSGHIVMGWTILEDLISIFGLILLPSLVFSEGAQNQLETLSYGVFLVFAKIAALAALVYFIGNKVIEKILKIIARTRSHELFTLAILASVFLIAVACSHFFGISIALGAFVAGTVVGRTELSQQASANALPMKDAFAVIFFLSVGMLFNPIAVLSNIPLFLGLLFILLLLRPFIGFLMLKIAKYPNYIAFTVAFAIGQIGEYSFILAEEGSRLKILPDNAYDIIVACAFITIALNPLLFQFFKPLTVEKKGADKTPEEIEALSLLEEEESTSFLPKAIVIGYGPVGRAVAKTLSKKYQVLVIDQNIDTISTHKNKEFQMIYGDATQLLILEQANLKQAQIIVITTPDLEITKAIIQSAQHINPYAEIIARIHYQSDYNPSLFGDIPVFCDEEATSEKMVKDLKGRYALA